MAEFLLFVIFQSSLFVFLEWALFHLASGGWFFDDFTRGNWRLWFLNLVVFFVLSSFPKFHTLLANGDNSINLIFFMILDNLLDWALSLHVLWMKFVKLCQVLLIRLLILWNLTLDVINLIHFNYFLQKVSTFVLVLHLVVIALFENLLSVRVKAEISLSLLDIHRTSHFSCLWSVRTFLHALYF